MVYTKTWKEMDEKRLSYFGNFLEAAKIVIKKFFIRFKESLKKL